MKNRGFIKIFIIAFSFFLQNMISFGETREVPNIIIKDNPKKEVYQIDTIKRRTKPAELNLTVTKIKSKEMNMKIDENNKKIIVDIEKITGGDEIVVVENLKDMPNSLTINGRKALNILGKTQNQNLKYRYYQRRSLNNTDRVEIEYINRPKEVYLGILNSKKELKTIYKSKFLPYELPKNNIVDLKIWLFAEELDKVNNLIFDPTLNNTGNFKLRASGDHSYPEGGKELKNLYSAFDMRGKPIDFGYSDDITVEVIGSGISAKNSQGDFYRYRNKYSEFELNGFNVKARIWSEFSGLELSLGKKGAIQDGYRKFTIQQKDKSGHLIQTINIELFINGKTIGNYFEFGAYTKSVVPKNDNYFNKYVAVPINVNVKNFNTDELDLRYPNPHIVNKRFGETGEQKSYTSSHQMKAKGAGFGKNSTNKINAKITEGDIYIEKSWFERLNKTVQFFYSDGIQMTYAKGKRYIPVRTQLCIFMGNWDKSVEKIVGYITGLPILDSFLDKKNINGGVSTIKFEGNAQVFKFSQNIKKNEIYVFKEDKFLKKVTLSKSDVLSIIDNGVKFSLKYGLKDNSYDHYYFVINHMNLENKDRKIIISGINDKVNKGIVVKENVINIPKFNPIILINKNNSSIKNNITLYEEVSLDFLNENNGKNIDLGTIYTASLNKAILRENCSNKPKILIDDDLYLEAQSNVTYKFIPIDIVFNKLNKKLMEINLSDNTISNDRLVLKMSKDSYEKFIKNGGDVTYLVKSKKTNKICSVYLEADKTPVGNKISQRTFESSIIDEIKIITKSINPSIGSLKFLKEYPIILDEIKLLKNTVKYVNSSVSTTGLQLIGNIQELIQNEKHNVEVIDASGKKINGIIDKGGNGGYFSGLSMGDENLITLRYKRNDKATYLLLEKWNYEKAIGDIVVKHYIGSSNIIGQYYKIKIEVPQLDPYIYYNETYNSLTIKKGQNIEKEINYTNNKLELGYVSLKDCNMDITIHITGNQIDREGMRIESNTKDVDIFKLGTNISIGKGKIKLVSENGSEITDNKIIGKSKYAKVVLELPSNMPKVGDYEVKSGIGPNILFDNNQHNYLLKIGRNGYWKEIINKITLKGLKKLDGSATLKISNSYKENTKITFETIDYDSLNTSKLKDPVPEGVSLENRAGYGMLKGKNGDKAYIKYKGENIDLGNLDSSGNTSSSKKIDLNSGNQIEVQYKNGEFIINLVKRKLGIQIDEDISVCLNRENNQVLEFKLKISIEESWFKILNKEILDFGDIMAGSKNLDAKASMILETSGGIQFENIKVKLKDSKISLYPVSTPNEKDLEAHIVYYELKKESTQNIYKVDVEGKLDTQDTSRIGEQKGTAEFIIEIKE